MLIHMATKYEIGPYADNMLYIMLLVKILLIPIKHDYCKKIKIQSHTYYQ